MSHRMLPFSTRTDFQNLPAWRSCAHEILDTVVRNHESPVIVPMTLIDPGYFAEIIGRLRDDGTTCAISPCWLSAAPCCSASTDADSVSA